MTVCLIEPVLPRSWIFNSPLDALEEWRLDGLHLFYWLPYELPPGEYASLWRSLSESPNFLRFFFFATKSLYDVRKVCASCPKGGAGSYCPFYVEDIYEKEDQVFIFCQHLESSVGVVRAIPTKEAEGYKTKKYALCVIGREVERFCIKCGFLEGDESGSFSLPPFFLGLEEAQAHFEKAFRGSAEAKKTAEEVVSAWKRAKTSKPFVFAILKP